MMEQYPIDPRGSIPMEPEPVPTEDFDDLLDMPLLDTDPVFASPPPSNPAVRPGRSTPAAARVESVLIEMTTKRIVLMWLMDAAVQVPCHQSVVDYILEKLDVP